MNIQRIEQYGDITLLNISCNEETEVNRQNATYIRVKTPATEKMQRCFINQGFFYADRMLKASINLKKVNLCYEKMIRMEIRKTNEYRDEVLKIALKSFPVDRRFHVTQHYDDEVASKIITSWVDSIEEYYVCIYHDKAIGFAALEEQENGFYEIRLAAVDERYRLSGAAFSLYAYLAKLCMEKNAVGGGRCLYGWISTVNTAVMNLYAKLGASFSEPSDIFLGCGPG